MEIKVEKLPQKALSEKGVFSWPIWEKETSVFDWFYDEQEACYFLEGEVEVSSSEGNKTYITQGDFVIFPKGLRCTWNIKSRVKKHYNFG